MKYAPVSNISHASLEDGEGIRTVVFLAGCGLNCRWCHNPEAISQSSKVMFYKDKCIGCKECEKIDCPALCGDISSYDATACNGCARCETECLGDAIRLSSRKMSVSEVTLEVERDLRYYRHSGGGVTFSGGECLLYPDFMECILSLCKEREIHTAVESSLFVPRENIVRLISLIDKFYFDIKLIDPNEHRIYTSHSNERILENAAYVLENHPNVTVRIPLIPSVTDTEENLFGILDFLSKAPSLGEKRVELLRYNSLADAKYSALGMRYENFGKAQTIEEIYALKEALRERYRGVDII